MNVFFKTNYYYLIFILIVFLSLTGCSSSEDPKKEIFNSLRGLISFSFIIYILLLAITLLIPKLPKFDFYNIFRKNCVEGLKILGVFLIVINLLLFIADLKKIFSINIYEQQLLSSSAFYRNIIFLIFSISIISWCDTEDKSEQSLYTKIMSISVSFYIVIYFLTSKGAQYINLLNIK